jgi:hypothetical protein
VASTTLHRYLVAKRKGQVPDLRYESKENSARLEVPFVDNENYMRMSGENRPVPCT